MRIIAGQFKRRQLAPPPDAKTSRPMPDRVKEAIFNLLRGHVQGEAVMDVFAGVGTMGLEALSRGAARVVMVEKDRAIARLLEGNLASLGDPGGAELVVGDALGAGALSRCPEPVHLVFFDPPYPLVEDPLRRDRTFRALCGYIARLDATGYAVLRTPWPLTDNGREVSLTLEGAVGPETHRYGSMAVHLYMREGAPSSAPEERLE
jgi:16S rRNA (guanine(966)-N(2))-methyltransferase RsmD